MSEQAITDTRTAAVSALLAAARATLKSDATRRAAALAMLAAEGWADETGGITQAGRDGNASALARSIVPAGKYVAVTGKARSAALAAADAPDAPKDARAYGAYLRLLAVVQTALSDAIRDAKATAGDAPVKRQTRGGKVATPTVAAPSAPIVKPAESVKATLAALASGTTPEGMEADDAIAILDLAGQVASTDTPAPAALLRGMITRSQSDADTFEACRAYVARFASQFALATPADLSLVASA
jgi:hypothetical protein